MRESSACAVVGERQERRGRQLAEAGIVASTQQRPVLAGGRRFKRIPGPSSGLTDPHMGFLSTAIFRASNKYNMGICGGMKPWAGQLTPRVAVIAKGTKSPNAAKLFVHFMMSGDGMEPQLIDGKMATNINTKMPDNEASGISKYVDQLHVTNSSTTNQDFAKLQDWQDLWTIQSRR